MGTPLNALTRPLTWPTTWMSKGGVSNPVAELDELDELGVADWMSKGRKSTQRRLSADRDG